MVTRPGHGLLLFALAALASAPVAGRNVVLSNDNGLTSNVKAMYEAVKAEGHDVIVSVPCTGRSGMGGAIKIMRPLPALGADCLHGASLKGDPGAGPMTRPGMGPDYFQVDGTPVMATLYGIDVAAAARWGKAPDLVLSGPNEGQNIGTIVVSSGTVSNVQYAMMRGIPAIAISAGTGTTGGNDLSNPESVLVARRTLELLRLLDKRAGGGAMLPASVGLNVIFPDEPEAASRQLARIGNHQGYEFRFVTDMAAAMGKPAGTAPPLPGLYGHRTQQLPSPSQKHDEATVSATDSAVSVMQIAYDTPPATARAIKRQLKDLLAN